MSYWDNFGEAGWEITRLEKENNALKVRLKKAEQTPCEWCASTAEQLEHIKYVEKQSMLDTLKLRRVMDKLDKIAPCVAHINAESIKGKHHG